MQKINKIGVFDSGVGGLTFYKEIKKVTNIPIIYFGDTKRAPYGSKSKEVLTSHANEIINFLERKDCEAFVAACNTLASNVVFDRQVTELISYAVQDALKETKTGKIGLFATEATVKSGIFKKLIPNLSLTACPDFVPLIESGELDTKNVYEAVEKYLEKLGDIDTLILGCTHYPLIKPVITKLTNATLINPAYMAARSFTKINSENKIDDEFYVSGDTKKFEQFFERIFGYEIEAKQKIF
ncbi:MAG: glutamate racemase [Defluviitaleaceae bacterium]|nr:glutamate racemase [Defluviitaleaceae bacterium]